MATLLESTVDLLESIGAGGDPTVRLYGGVARKGRGGGGYFLSDVVAWVNGSNRVAPSEPAEVR